MVDARTGRIITTQEQIGSQVNLKIQSYEQQTTALEDQLAALGKMLSSSSSKTTTKKTTSKSTSKSKKDKSIAEVLAPGKVTAEEVTKMSKKEKEKTSSKWSSVLPWL